MKQAVMVEPGKIEFRDVDIPKIGKDDVLIKVMSIGICGSDMHVYLGKHPWATFPIILGHEIAGQIVEIGENVKSLKIGDKVTVEPQGWCGKCYNCRQGRYNICEEHTIVGYHTVGASSEFFAIAARNVLKFDDKISYDEGAMIEVISVGCHAADRAEVPGKNVVVIGAGPIGNVVAQVSKQKGAKSVMITDISDYRLSLAKECGVDHCINVGKQDFETELIKAFGPDKADVIIECVGSEATFSSAMVNARKGTDIIVVGVIGKDPTLPASLIEDNELCLKGSVMYVKEDFETAIRLLEENKLVIAPLISKCIPFKEYLNGYKYIAEEREHGMKAMKVIVRVQE